MMKLISIISVAALGLGISLLLVTPAARADEAAPSPNAIPEITLERGRFNPSEVVVPANTAFKLQVTNKDKDTIEFESFELHRERAVQPGETITVYMPSLSPGTYEFVDDFHSGTPKGAIVAK
jgi:heme/copper-type cytochrome/quinol oxidase subunit 2